MREDSKPTNQPDSDYLRYWGKASESEGTLTHHPVAYHSADVAATVDTLLTHRPAWLTALAAELPWKAASIKALLVFLGLLHDIGKFAIGFQQLIPDLAQQLSCGGGVPYRPRHDAAGWTLLLHDVSIRSAVVRAVFGDRDYDEDDALDLIAPWLSAAVGHHGKPCVAEPRLLNEQFPRHVRSAVLAYIRDAAELLNIEPLHFDDDSFKTIVRATTRLSWYVAGIFVAADWVGSNTEHFPYTQPTRTIKQYWDIARASAQRAIACAGLRSATPTQSDSSLLFPYLDPPTRLQRWALENHLEAGPQCHILEDLTGSGKTEAALILANRLISSGTASGLFFALPTMATANAMFSRVSKVANALFADPSVVLAHGKSKLALALHEAKPDKNYDGGEQTASNHASAWLRTSTRQALLADIGVGTVDQAMMAALAVKFQSLRAIGLLGKVLVVDEVHACDAYMLEILAQTLTLHARGGGAAVLLTATLPHKTKEVLLNAFNRGLQEADAEHQNLVLRSPATSELSIPLVTSLLPDREVTVTHLSEGSASQSKPTLEPRTSRTSIKFYRSDADCLKAITEAAESGQCVCWIRNTIKTATAAFDQLRTGFPEGRVHVFHSRFALGDRLSIETKVLKWFGPTSTAEERAGRVLIATQVVEQSLDLDFDMLISDLAPADLMIQRAGRLRRHARDAHGNRTPGEESRPPLPLGIHAPSATLDADDTWLQDALAGTGFVYPDYAVLWRTVRWFEDEGELVLPNKSRELVEYAYDATVLTPPHLLGQSIAVRQQTSAERSKAIVNAVELDRGYLAAGNRGFAKDSEDRPRTRLGEETHEVLLMKLAGDEFVPFIDGTHGFQLSLLRLRTSLVDGEASTATGARANTRIPEELLTHILVVAMEPYDAKDHTWVGTATQNGNLIQLTYNNTRGLMFEATGANQ